MQSTLRGASEVLTIALGRVAALADVVGCAAVAGRSVKFAVRPERDAAAVVVPIRSSISSTIRSVLAEALPGVGRRRREIRFRRSCGPSPSRAAARSGAL